MLEVKQTASAVTGGVKSAAVLAAEITIGNVINDRIFKMAVPHLPMGASVFLNNAPGKALIANAFAAGLIHFVPTNAKAVQAANLMIQSATIELAGSLNIEAMVDDFLDGITLPGETPKATNKPEPVDFNQPQA